MKATSRAGLTPWSLILPGLLWLHVNAFSQDEVNK